MKRYLTTLFLIAVTAALMAIPAKHGIRKTITLPNGVEKTVTLVGDEHLHYYVDDEGNVYVDTDGSYVKADINGLRKHGLERRKSAQRHREARMPRLQNTPAGRRNARKVPNFTGKKKGLIILVEFSNVAFQEGNDKALYNRIANEKNFKYGDFVGSVADYFYAQSYGKFELSFDIAGPVKLSKEQSYYGRNNALGDDMHPGEMVIEALEAIKDTTDFSLYDWDGDNEVDQVYIIYAGRGEADGGGSNVIWPHEYTLTEEGEIEPGVKPQSYNGITIDTYACSNELDQDRKTAGIGNICHEFSHCLGYPDLYDLEYLNPGMGYWDLMDSGAYNGDSYCPPEFSSYERWMAGWKELIELKEETEIKDMKAISDNGNCYIMRNDNCDTEYYLLENRQPKGWDKELPGSGLLILYVDYYEDVWKDNSVNTTSGEYSNGKGHECLTWVAADNKKKYTVWSGERYYDFDDMKTDTYPYEECDSFCNRSTPAAIVNHKNTDGSMLLNKKITNIKQNADGTISFNFALDSGSGSTPADGTIFFQETFNKTTGTGGNDNKWSKTIANAELKYDNDGWTASWGGGGDQCARFGSSNVVGTATTPSFRIEGEVTLTFKAAAWGSEDTKLTLRSEGATITGDSSFTLENEAWGTYTTTLSGSGEVQLTFTTVASNRRFFLDEVMVFASSTTGISEVDVARKESRRGIYTLDGRRVTADGTLPHGIYIVDGKKVVR